METGEQEVRALEAEMQAEQKTTEQEMAAVSAEYKEMEQIFRIRNDARMQAVGAVL